MNGDKNKPLNSSQLHQGNSIEVSVRKNTAAVDKPQPAEATAEKDTVSIKVENPNSSLSTEPNDLQDTAATHVELEETPSTTYKPEIDIAEELKIEEKIEPAVPPVTEPKANTKAGAEPKTTASESPTNSPGILVLQWLTYAFWGWTCLAMIWLTFVVSTHLIGGSQASSNMSAYILAAVLVLLPLSIVCDWFYSRKEPSKKTGAAMILMILHAVLFALLAIGALIIFMYALVQYMLVPPSDLTSIYVMMTTSISVAIIYLVVFLRTLNPMPKKKPGLMLSIFMFIAIAILVAINITGPIKTQKAIQQDNQTSEQLMTLVSSLNQHAETHNDLPANLSSSGFKGKDNPLVVNNAVEYSKYKQASSATLIKPGDGLQEYKENNSLQDDKKVVKIAFRLCVNYQVDTSAEYTDDSLTIAQPSDSFYANQDHKAGKNCYELYTFVSANQ